MATSLSDILSAIQNGVTAANNLNTLVANATLNSSSLRVTIGSTIFLTASSTNFIGDAPSDGNLYGRKNALWSVVPGVVSPSQLTASLSSDVALNSLANYFPGPRISQGTTGTWWVSGFVTVLGPSAPAQILCKLWDGTSVIASGVQYIGVAGAYGTVHLSGYITSPSSDLKISCRDVNFTDGLIKSNFTGNSQDSVISAFRIA